MCLVSLKTDALFSNIEEVLCGLGQRAGQNQWNNKGTCHELCIRIDSWCGDNQGFRRNRQIHPQQPATYRQRCDNVLPHGCCAGVGSYKSGSTAKLDHIHILIVPYFGSPRSNFTRYLHGHYSEHIHFFLTLSADLMNTHKIYL